MNEITSGCLLLSFSWSMLLEYSSTFELYIPSIWTTKTEKSENVVAREIATGKTMTLFRTLIFKTMMNSRCRSGLITWIYDGPPYGTRHSYHLLTTVAKNSILDVWKGPRSFSDIYEILIFYILKKQKRLLYLPLSIVVTVKK